MAKTRILVVDDEVYIQELLRAAFEDAGYECVTRGSAEEALTILAAEAFEVMFVDIRLPGKQGPDLLEELRRSWPDMVVVMVTAVDEASAAVDAIRRGAYDYIVKPFHLDEVIVAANRAVEKRRLEDANREYQAYLEHIAAERAAETRRLFYSMTQVLIRLMELKVPFRAGHATRVAEMSRYVARELKMTEDGVRKVYLAGLLHDVGMFAVTDLLLHKQEGLTDDEFRQVRAHPSASEDMLKPILSDEEVLKYIRHHHERYDGTGYPDGLKGNIIPLGARIISVVDAFDSMTRERPYRDAARPEEALAELRRCADSQFDQHVVAVFAELYEQVFRNIEASERGAP
jgi:putative two-component system response regulator